MGSGNEPKDLTSVYIMGRLDALHNVQKQTDELEQKIADLETELAVVNLALRNAKKDDWSGMGFELDDEVVDRFSRNAIENARRQLNAEKEQS